MSDNKKTVLFYVLNFHPELNGCGKYTGEQAKWLEEQGVQCTVITSPPYYPEWKVYPHYNRFFYTCEKLNGINVTRCPIFILDKGSFFSRVFLQMSFILSSLPVLIWNLLRYKPNIVFVVEPCFLCLFPAWLFKLAQTKIWMHIQDFEIDAALATKIIRHKTLVNILTKFEEFFLKKCDVVSTISKSMMKKLESKVHHDKSKTYLLPNWIKVDNGTITSREEIRSSLRIPLNKFVILYSGNLGKKQGLEILIDAAKELINENDFFFVICGDGSEKENLRERAQNSENILWLPLQKEELFRSFLLAVDLHMIIQQSEIADSVFPSKLLGILESGIPVLCVSNKDSELGEIATKHGSLLETQSPAELATKIKEIKSNYQERVDVAESARTWVLSEFEMNKVLTRFKEKLNELAK